MNYSFGNWIKQRRKALDLTQQELAQRVGCSLSLIFKIEADERRPSRQIAELLAEYLEIPADQRTLFLRVARKEKTPDLLDAPSFGDAVRSVPSFIPTILTSGKPLVGREIELAEIVRLIHTPQCRLLTLTGQGGIGKTHLALHATASFEAKKTNTRVAVVNLAPVAGREQIVTAIADALGIVLYAASDRARQLISYLHDRETLLVLDNFEQLILDPDSVDLIGFLLQEIQSIKLIVTSRQPLHLQAEWVFEVQGLPVPKSHRPEDLKTSSAVALFLQRANQAAVGFNPSGEDLSAIAQICELVEGLPLGIELAAAWVRTLTVNEIANEIQKSINFLATTVRDLPERHRSIRAAIEHSWKLLSTDEQRIISRLSVFRGGFDRHAAEVVASASLADLQTLVSKSLIRRAQPGRYDMHELIYQYAMDRLRSDPTEDERVRIKHSQYYAALLEQRGPALKGNHRPTVVAELITDLPNLRLAWQWASSRQQASEICQSADTLFWLYESRSNCREGVPLYGEAVKAIQSGGQFSRDGANSTQRLALGQALTYMGYFLFRQGQHPQARAVLKSGLEILNAIPERESDDVRLAYSNALVFLGTIISVMGDFTEGDQLLQQGLHVKHELGDRWGSAFCLRQIGFSAYYQGDYIKSFEAAEQSYRISQDAGNTWSLAASLNQLGLIAISLGRHEQAQQYLNKGLELSRSIEDRASIAASLDGLGLVSSSVGDYTSAQLYLEESIALWDEIGEQGSYAQTLNHYGALKLKAGDISTARKYFSEALRVAVNAQITPVWLDALIGEAEIRIYEGRIDSAAELLSVVSQSPSIPHATRVHAEKLRTDLNRRGLTEHSGLSIGTGKTMLETFTQEILKT